MKTQISAISIIVLASSVYGALPWQTEMLNLVNGARSQAKLPSVCLNRYPFDY